MEGISNGVTLQSYVWQIILHQSLMLVSVFGIRLVKLISSGVQKASIGTCPSLYQYAVMWSGTLSYIGSRVNKSWLLCSQVLGCLLVL